MITPGIPADLRLAGYPPGTRHIVVYKRAVAWARSIINWGLRCGW
ncbi:MAG: hypothetical protein ACKO5A_03960 [Actinomycetota bacterium]